VGPWARAFLAQFDAVPAVDAAAVTELRFEPALITARVADETVTLSAPPIPAGVWTAIDPVRTDLQSENLGHLLEHTWEEPLIPEHVVSVGSARAVSAVAEAAAEAIDAEPALLLRWRGYASAAPTGDEWSGASLPDVPAAARRPPDSVPKRFGSSGIQRGGDDLVEALVRVYDVFSA
jgi:hypothetical protein